MKPGQSIQFLSGGRLQQAAADDIMLVCRCNSQTVIHTLNEKFVTPYSLAEVLRKLPGTCFFRVNKSTFVALRHIQRIDGNLVRVAGKKVKMTDYYKLQMNADLARQVKMAAFFFAANM